MDRNAQWVASALNRHFADHGHGRPFVGVDIQQEVKQWGVDRDEAKQAAGHEVGLNRVPCPSSLHTCHHIIYATANTKLPEPTAKASASCGEAS